VPAVLESYLTFLSRAASAFEIAEHNCLRLPTRIKRFTVLKAVHVYKKHRAQVCVGSRWWKGFLQSSLLQQHSMRSAPIAESFEYGGWLFFNH
jgi:hypothetical protein